MRRERISKPKGTTDKNAKKRKSGVEAGGPKKKKRATATANKDGVEIEELIEPIENVWLSTTLSALKSLCILTDATISTPSGAPLPPSLQSLPQPRTIGTLIQAMVSKIIRLNRRTSDQRAPIVRGKLGKDTMDVPKAVLNTTFEQQTNWVMTQIGNKDNQIHRVNSLESWFHVLINKHAEQMQTTTNKSYTVATAAKEFHDRTNTTGTSNTTTRRLQFYWVLLSHFREKGASNLISYRTPIANEILRNDTSARLQPNDIDPWIPIIENIGTTVKNFCLTTRLANTTTPKPASRWKFV